MSNRNLIAGLREMAECIRDNFPWDEDDVVRQCQMAADELEAKRVPPICTWAYDGDCAKWDTDCGEAFELSNDATLDDNKIAFCPFCGKRISEVS